MPCVAGATMNGMVKIVAWFAIAAALVACGGSTEDSGVGAGGAGTGGSTGTGGLAAFGGSMGTGGQTGGASGTGGSAGTGGSSGIGGQTGGAAGTGGSAGAGGSPLTDSGPSVVCADDAGIHLASVARGCVNDVDCTVLYGQTCCSQSAYGIAKTAVVGYGGCFWTDVSKCMTGCASPNWYQTDTGAMTPMIPYGTDAKQYVAVHCTVGLCTTDALPRDAGGD
jgi:hypothetical protein